MLSGYGIRREFKSFSVSKTYARGDRPKRIDERWDVALTKVAYADFVTEACNRLAYNLRNNLGMGDDEIFGQNRTIKLELRTD